MGPFTGLRTFSFCQSQGTGLLLQGAEARAVDTIAGGSITSVSGGGASAAKPKAGGQGDPIMTGFDGRSFEFIGQPNTFYSLISERHHQVSPSHTADSSGRSSE